MNPSDNTASDEELAKRKVIPVEKKEEEVSGQHSEVRTEDSVEGRKDVALEQFTAAVSIKSASSHGEKKIARLTAVQNIGQKRTQSGLNPDGSQACILL